MSLKMRRASALLALVAAATVLLSFLAIGAHAQVGGVVRLARDTIRVGDTLAAPSVAFYNADNGRQQSGLPTWSSSNQPVARQIAGNRILGFSIGCTRITAELGKAGAWRTLCVIARSAPVPTPAPAPTPTPTPVPVPAPSPTPGDPGSPSGAPAPTLLPIAQVNHAMNVAAYVALKVPQLAAGASYRDPTTNVRITKLTSATFPGGSSSWGLQYFEGGTIISLPLDSTGRRKYHIFGSTGTQLIADWAPGAGVSNPKQFPSGGSPNADLCFAFSTNLATPYYAYALSGSQLVRIDTRTMTLAPGSGFPVANAGGGGWLQNSENDAAFAWMTGDKVTHYFEPATGRNVTYSNAAVNEPRLSRSGRYIGLSMDSPDNGLVMLDASTTPVTTVYTLRGYPDLPFGHNASLKDLWIGSAGDDRYPFPITTTGVAAGTAKREWGPSIGDHPVWNGAWIQPGDQRNAYVVGNSYGALTGKANYPNLDWTAPGGIVIANAAGDRRLLAFPYSNQIDYWGQSWPQFSTDGRVVVFSSDMLGSGRYDLFLAELPIR